MTSRLILSLMSFDEAWLADVAATLPDGVELRQTPAEAIDAVDPRLLERAEVLYTSRALPDPAVAPALRWVQLDTAGCDHVVGTPLWASTVAISSIGGVSERSMSEYVLAMVLNHAHRIPTVLADAPRRTWPSDAGRWERYGPRTLLGAKLVVVGYGRLGRAIAARAAALGLDVTGVRRGSDARSYANEPGGVRVATVDRLHETLVGADYVVVVTPATPETMGLIGAAELALPAPGAALIDVARGGVVVERDLLAALEGDGPLEWAALDVFEQEPLPADSVLWTHPQVWATPHVSGLAPDYAEAVRELFKANIARHLAGEPLVNAIDRGIGY